MLVLQQISVLPKGCMIEITDEGRVEIECMKSVFDDSLIFERTEDADLYNRVYQTFRVAWMDVDIVNDVKKFIIKIRG